MKSTKKKALSLILALAMCLSLITVTAIATPGREKAGATELTAGESDTFTGYGDYGSYWYKFELNAASRVVITLSMENPKLNESANLSVSHGIDGYRETDIGNQQFCYVSEPGGALPEYDLHINVACPENNGIPSKTGAFYLAEGWHYIKVVHYLSMDNPARITVSIDSIEPISNTGGLTMESARTIDPARDVIKQYSYDRQDGLHNYYWKFTLTEAAMVSIEKSVRLIPCDDREWRVSASSSLRLFAPDPSSSDNEGNAIWWEADGESGQLLTIHENDANLSRTITYELPAGTYYVKLHTYWAMRGNEYTLTFSTPGATDPQPGGAPNIDSADGWARAAIESAYAKGFIPADIQSSYTDVITRAEFCRLAVMWMEYVLGQGIDEILAQRADSLREGTFSDTSDPAILAAFKLRIINGTTMPAAGSPGVFTPNGNFNRQMAARLIMNVCEAVGADISNPPASDFVDLNTAETWARDGINYCRKYGIMGGTSTATPTFSPNDNYTRQQGIMTFDNIKHDELPGMGNPDGGGTPDYSV